MAPTDDDIAKMAAVDPMFEWVYLPRLELASGGRSNRLSMLQTLAALKAVGVEYAAIPCSDIFMVRKWTEVAILAYEESMMADVCPIADFVVAFRESM